MSTKSQKLTLKIEAIVKKTELARKMFNEGDFLGALRICRNFRLGLTKEERRVMQIAYESLTGNASFYQSLGIDTAQAIEQSKLIVKKVIFVA